MVKSTKTKSKRKRQRTKKWVVHLQGGYIRTFSARTLSDAKNQARKIGKTLGYNPLGVQTKFEFEHGYSYVPM